MELSQAAGIHLDMQSVSDLKKAARQDEKIALEVAAKQFEAIMLQTVLKSVREANRVFESDLMSSDSLQMYEDMYDQQLSNQLSGQGFGFADMIVKQLSQDKISVQYQASYQVSDKDVSIISALEDDE